jgi:glycosyltransferase involved in cell wall biosynthesis
VNTTLTIAFPTYNRATLLDRQLGWLVRAVEGYERRCEILVADNGSTDETPVIVERRRAELAGRETHLECAAGTHFFVGNPRLGYKLDLGDTTELCARLAKIGYPPERCRRLARKRLAGQRRRLLKGPLRWPATGAGSLLRVGVDRASLVARANMPGRGRRETSTAPGGDSE